MTYLIVEVLIVTTFKNTTIMVCYMNQDSDEAQKVVDSCTYGLDGDSLENEFSASPEGVTSYCGSTTFDDPWDLTEELIDEYRDE